MKVPKFNWIPFDKNNPPVNLSLDNYLILLREKYYEEDDWDYSVDIAKPYGAYIDDFWDTDNDWQECQFALEVVAYAKLPEYFKEDKLVEEN